jgi:hypothetical protein
VLPTCRRSNRIAANCCHRVKMPFREVSPRHQCAERLRARRTGCVGVASSGSAAAICRFGGRGDGGRVRAGAQSPRVREAMRTLLNTISVLPFEREDAGVAAQLRANLNSQGAPIGAYDLLLAACALRRDSRSPRTMRGSSFASVGSGLRIGTAGKLRNPAICLGLPDECLARDLF